MTPSEPRRPDSLEALRLQLQQGGVRIAVDDDIQTLLSPLPLRSGSAPNRLCVLPMACSDATPDGAPSAATQRRYTGFAQGGFGIICIESTAVCQAGRDNERQLYLHSGTVGAYADCIRAMRNAAQARFEHNPVISLQLTHAAGDCSDAYLDPLIDTFVSAASMARRAGADAIDIDCYTPRLGAALLNGQVPSERYGGSPEKRSAFVCEIIRRVHDAEPELMIAPRLGLHDPQWHPHGVAKDDVDAIVDALHACRIDLLSVSAADHYVDPYTEKGKRDPWPGLAHALDITGALQARHTDLPIIGSGFSRLQEYMPHVAAAAIRTGVVAVAGLGRGALANPDLAADLLSHGQVDPQRTCILCNACDDLKHMGASVGCPVHDAAAFGEDFRHHKRFDLKVLTQEASRCLECAHAPCTAACPTHIDVPGFIRAFAEGDAAGSYDILSTSNPLPELCSHLCPTPMLCQGACVATVLHGKPIPIADIQYVVSWMARDAGQVGLRVPAAATGQSVAIVGGGPTGLAATRVLIERGHHVTLIERGTALGGSPASLIPDQRLPTPQPEIEALLAPAIAAQRLTVRTGTALGDDIELGALVDAHDAVLLATGLWAQNTLAHGDDIVPALRFLHEAKGGVRTSVPGEVALLAGDDTAMDGATVAHAMGADALYIIYDGPRSEMHWHKNEDWFNTPGVHFLPLTRTLDVVRDASGALQGLRIERLQADRATGALDVIPDSACVLDVGLVIESLGLKPDDDPARALPKGVYQAGGRTNGGATVVQCIAEGESIAAHIHSELGST